MGVYSLYLADAVAFIREVLQVQICEDLRAGHIFGPGAKGKFPKIITKFLYNDQKDRIWK